MHKEPRHDIFIRIIDRRQLVDHSYYVRVELLQGGGSEQSSIFASCENAGEARQCNGENAFIAKFHTKLSRSWATALDPFPPLQVKLQARCAADNEAFNYQSKAMLTFPESRSS
jgi:hypothetical protein